MKDKIDLVIKLIEEQKGSTDKRLDSIDDNLREHMRRTDVLEDLHRDNHLRIQTLEEPRKALAFIKTTALWLSAISGAILIIIRLFGKL